jgi:NAD(P)-dependent dehydrogenase (short-subunit alcohol dehydrogenase family)
MGSSEKIALITGAGSGIGRASALAFLKAGYKVVLTGRRMGALEETIAEAGSDASNALAVSCDVSDAGAVDGLFATIKEKFGRLDVVFNNAGANAPGKTIDELTPEEWSQVIDVNLTGSFLCARGAFAMMRHQKPQGGRIINNGSVSAHAPRPGSAPYTSSKHAITGLTKTISLDGRPFNIACGQIDIGNALTDMAARMVEGVPQANGTIEAEAVMDVAHVASTLLYMASLPLEANVQFVTIMATKMPFVGRG